MSTVTPMIEWMQSLSEPTRGRLLRVLEKSELSVAEICSVLQLPQSTVSRHLKVLLDDGWVVGRREGTSNWYRMNSGEMPGNQKKLWNIAKNHCLPDSTAEQDESRLEKVLDGRKSKSQSFFSSAAGRWDRIRAELFGHQLDASAIAATMDRNWIAGDLGCGTGSLSQTLAPWIQQVISVDSSSEMIQAAKRRLKDLNNIDVRKGELTSLPIDDNCLDVAFLGLVLPYLPQPARVFEEVARTTKVAGRLVVLDMVTHDRGEFRDEFGHMWLGFSQAQIFDWMGQAGWRPENWVPLHLDPEAKGTPVFVATAKRLPNGS